MTKFGPNLILPSTYYVVDKLKIFICNKYFNVVCPSSLENAIYLQHVIHKNGQVFGEFECLVLRNNAISQNFAATFDYNLTKSQHFVTDRWICTLVYKHHNFCK